MATLTEYKTVRAEDAATLDRLVNEAIEAGFQLYGNPYVLEKLACQALVRDKRSESRGAAVSLRP